jgi:hypothetical protein
MRTKNSAWPAHKPEIDLALDVTRRLMKPGDSLSGRDIAEICGCSASLIQQTEREAVRKLRKAMRRMLNMDFEEFAEFKL